MSMPKFKYPCLAAVIRGPAEGDEDEPDASSRLGLSARLVRPKGDSPAIRYRGSNVYKFGDNSVLVEWVGPGGWPDSFVMILTDADVHKIAGRLDELRATRRP